MCFASPSTHHPMAESKPWLLVSIAAFLSACPAAPGERHSPRTAPSAPNDEQAEVKREPASAPRPALSYLDLEAQRLKEAEDKATPGGRAVLAAARQMIAEDLVVRGSCWDYANAVYVRAGFKGWRQQKVAYRARTRGPYADPGLVQAGDWLYIINHPPTLSTHSLIFVHWTDFPRREAMTVTYVGDRREQPGYYRTYDVSRIYQIIRPRDP